MRTEEIITRLFCMADDKLGPAKKRKNANLYASEIITIGILFCLKGVHYRAFYRWLKGDWQDLFPKLPSGMDPSSQTALQAKTALQNK